MTALWASSGLILSRVVFQPECVAAVCPLMLLHRSSERKAKAMQVGRVDGAERHLSTLCLAALRCAVLRCLVRLSWLPTALRRWTLH